MKEAGLLAGDTVVLRCPRAHPRPTYLQEFSFSVAFGFSEKWRPRKATALRMSLHAGGQLAKFLRTNERYPVTIEIVPVDRRTP